MNHRWPERDKWNVVSAHESRDGNEHHIRQCLICELVKVTIIPPIVADTWHEWITNSGDVWLGEATPPCIPRHAVVESGRAPGEVPFS